MSLKINTNIPIHQKATELYQQGLEDLLTPTKLPCLLFNCKTLQTLQSLISEFGEVIVWESPDYSMNMEPTLTVMKKGKDVNEFYANGLSIDETNKLVYIADNGNSRIQVLSIVGKFVTSFGRQILGRDHGV